MLFGMSKKSFANLLSFLGQKSLLGRCHAGYLYPQAATRIRLLRDETSATIRRFSSNSRSLGSLFLAGVPIIANLAPRKRLRWRGRPRRGFTGRGIRFFYQPIRVNRQRGDRERLFFVRDPLPILIALDEEENNSRKRWIVP